MSFVTHRTEDTTLYLELNGRIDSSNAAEADRTIQELMAAHPGLEPVLDAEKLEFISSAGLRVLLRLRKALSRLKIINVNTEVYEILEMTGFTDLLTVEKAFRRLSVEGCELIAQGANGRIYRYDEESIVKIYYNGASLEEIRLEKDMCRRVFIKGINTAIPYDVVRVGDYYGSVAEMLNATSVAKLIRRQPESLDEVMALYTQLLRLIHKTEVLPGEMPSAKAIGVDWAQFLQPYLPEDQWTKLMAMMNAISEPGFMIHGDYHANNVMIQDGEPMLIDMDTVAMGHPIFEFAAVYLGFVGFSEEDHNVTMEFYGLPRETTVRMWNWLLNDYFHGDREMIRSVEQKAMIIAYARLMRRTIRRNGLNTPDGRSRIELCKKHLAELLPLVDRLDY